MSVVAGIDLVLGAIYVVTTVKTTISAVQYANSWVRWFEDKRRKKARGGEGGIDAAWQWVDTVDDEFEIEKMW